MTTERHLNLMSLMNDIEAPTKTYRSALRKAWATETDSPANNAAKAKGNAALEEIEDVVREWVANHPAASAEPHPADELARIERELLAVLAADQAKYPEGPKAQGRLYLLTALRIVQGDRFGVPAAQVSA